MSDVCSRWEERLMGLLYEDGDATEQAETRAHVAACAGCRAELERLGSTRDLLSAWPNAVNAPRMVYVNEPAAAASGLGGLAERVRRWWPRAVLVPVLASAAMILVAVAVAAMLDLEVTPDGTVRVGLLSSVPAPIAAEDVPITREELRAELGDVIASIEQVLEARRGEERRLLLAAIDERIQEQGLAMSQELRGAVGDAFVDVQHQHEDDLRLIFSAIDEMGVMTASELNRMNAVLGSLAMPRPGY